MRVWFCIGFITWKEKQPIPVLFYFTVIRVDLSFILLIFLVVPCFIYFTLPTSMIINRMHVGKKNLIDMTLIMGDLFFVWYSLFSNVCIRIATYMYLHATIKTKWHVPCINVIVLIYIGFHPSINSPWFRI